MNIRFKHCFLSTLLISVNQPTNNNQLRATGISLQQVIATLSSHCYVHRKMQLATSLSHLNRFTLKIKLTLW
jgi:hypothetical protein